MYWLVHFPTVLLVWPARSASCELSEFCTLGWLTLRSSTSHFLQSARAPATSYSRQVRQPLPTASKSTSQLSTVLKYPKHRQYHISLWLDIKAYYHASSRDSGRHILSRGWGRDMSPPSCRFDSAPFVLKPVAIGSHYKPSHRLFKKLTSK